MARFDTLSHVGRLATFLWGHAESEPAPAPSFAVDANSIDPAVFGLTSYTAPTVPAARIDRKAAIQVPAVKRCRDLVAGSLGSLPIDLYGPDRKPSVSQLLTQPEANVPRGVTMTRLVEDLLFEGIGWWRVTEFGWHSYPTRVKRLDPLTVDVRKDGVYVDGRFVPDAELIRFDSPNDGLLTAGARAIRTALTLDAAVARYAEGAPPVDYFTPADPNEEPDAATVPQILDDWKSARQSRSTGYVPAALKYNIAGWNPEQLQLATQRQHAVLEIARTAGVDPEELGVSTTSRTYANQFDRRKAFLDFTLGGYITAIQDRLNMADVTPRGYYARVNLDAFLRSDTMTRYQAYEVGLRVGALAPEEVRQLEDRPPLPSAAADVEMSDSVSRVIQQVYLGVGTVITADEARQIINDSGGKLPIPAPPELHGGTVTPAPDPTADTVAASAAPAASFDTAPSLRLDAPGAAAFTVDVAKRTITGLAVPYGVPARSNGQLWQFSQGTLKYADVSRVKLWVQHDQAQAVGVATALDDRADGLYPTFKVARGPEGDRALSLAEDGVLDGLSIGLGQGGRFTRKDNVNHAVEAPLMEISLTPAPSFDDARVHAVAASATSGEAMSTPVIEPEVTAPAADFSVLTAPITDAIASGFAGLATPQRQAVSAAEPVQVREQLPYRFDGIAGPHSFSQDLRDAYMSGDTEARQRIDTFMDEAFAVTTANVGTLNPTQNRPELYVPNLSYSRPLFDLVSTGAIADKTPFTVPKFSSASGLVGNHTEAVEPTPGAFAATSQTVTPGALSGKIEIVREVWDQGGSPQADGIIWGEMLNGWFEAIEAKIAAVLATTGTAELNLAGAVDTALQDQLISYYANLQFARGGNRFTATAADAKLFPALVSAKDTAGRKLFPVVGPVNAEGTTSGGFDSVQIGNQRVAAAWALGQGANTRSYNFVPSSVWCWTSAPKKFTFEYQVKSIDMAIWGYAATAILRDSDVKPIDYDTADV